MHSYMFSPKPNILSAADEVRKQFKFSTFPDVALHVRRGDKLGDPLSKQEDWISIDSYFKVAEKLIVDAAKALDDDRIILVYVATDSKEAMDSAREWEKGRGAGLNFKIIMQDNEIANLEGKQIADAGNQLSGDKKYAEALEFLVDLHFMMHAKYFVGLCMSQPARVVVNIGMAKGSMIRAVAMDEKDIKVVDWMKFGIEEGWSNMSDVLSS